MESNAVSPPRRWQFSLQSGLWLIVVAAVGAAYWNSSIWAEKNRELVTEVRRLRTEVGELVVELGDENKLHAIPIACLDAMTWKWRVYVPKGRNFVLRNATGEIPLAGAPTNRSGGGTATLWPGESVITVALRRDHRDEWQWIVNHRNGETRSSASPEIKQLVEGNYSTSSASCGALTIVKPGGELELLRLRILPPASQALPNMAASGPAQGILIWISEKTPEP